MGQNGKNPNVGKWPSMWSSQGSTSRRSNNEGNERRRRETSMSISPNRYSTSSSSSSSPPSSCVSSESEDGKSSPENNAPMVLAGCPICLMYVMLSEKDPRCPRCKNNVLIDFPNDTKNEASTSRKSRKN